MESRSPHQAGRFLFVATLTLGSRRCNSGWALAIQARNMRCTGTMSASWRPTSSPRCTASRPGRRSSAASSPKGGSAGNECCSLKPQTFMNDSGDAVQQAMRFYKLDMDDLTVFHDELDLAPFKVKVKVGGGTAGHNGLRSIDAALGPDFRRVRIGIGHPGPGPEGPRDSARPRQLCEARDGASSPTCSRRSPARPNGWQTATTPRFMSEVALRLQQPTD